jgi:hypothetical protein
VEAHHASRVGCPICGREEHPLTVHINLSPEQLNDLGLKPDALPGGISIMAEAEQRSRYPKQEVNEGQKHGYIGADVDVYDPETGKVVGKGVRPADALDQSETDETVTGEQGTVKSDDTAESDAARPQGGTIRRGNR